MDLHELRDRLDYLENRGAAAVDLEKLFAEEFPVTTARRAPKKHEKSKRVDGCEARPRGKTTTVVSREHPLTY